MTIGEPVAKGASSVTVMTLGCLDKVPRMVTVDVTVVAGKAGLLGFSAEIGPGGAADPATVSG